MLSLCITFSFFQINVSGQWSHTQLTTFCVRAGAVSLGDKVYIAGGARLSALDPSAIVDIYDFSTEKWTTDKLSVAREMPAAVCCGSKVFFAGGINFINLKHFADVDIYDTKTKQWTKAQLSKSRFSIAAVSYKNQVLFAGGSDLLNDSALSVIDIYNMETNKWTTASLSEGRSAMGFAVSGSKAVFAGGFTHTSVSGKVDIYDFEKGTWTTASLSLPRGFLTATAVGNKIIIAGGITANNLPTDRVDIYDVVTDKWTTSNLSVARAFVDNAATACGKAFFAGGGKINLENVQWDMVSEVVDIYDPETEKWSIEKLRNPITNHNVTSCLNHILVIGGTNLKDAFSYVDIYTCLSTSVKTPSDKQGLIYVSPNPANGWTSINFAEIQNEVKTTVFTISGEIIFESDFQNSTRIKLDLTTFKSGIYFIKTETKNICVTKKLIVT